MYHLESLMFKLHEGHTTLKEISVQSVMPCVITGSWSSVLPSQQSSSIHRQPASNACLYISTEDFPVNWWPNERHNIIFFLRDLKLENFPTRYSLWASNVSFPLAQGAIRPSQQPAKSLNEQTKSWPGQIKFESYLLQEQAGIEVFFNLEDGTCTCIFWLTRSLQAFTRATLNDIA